MFACTPEENNTSGTDEPGGGKDNTVHVTGISIDRSSATIKEGETITLVATVTPANAENKAVTWSSSSDAVASVDKEGKVTGVKAGSATITATTEDGGKTATCALSVEANNAPSVTVDADHISAISVVLHGKANLGSSVASDLKIGFQYSKSAGILPSNSTTVDAEDADANYNYTTTITGLEPDTKYYFRSFARQNGQDTYGETKEFTTKDLASLLETKEATNISALSARLNATVNLTDVKFDTKTTGFYWGTSSESVSRKIDATEENGVVSADLSKLYPSTEYFFQAYIILDGKELRAPILSFTTKDIETLLETLDATDIKATSVKLNAKLDMTDVKCSSKSYGFYFGTSETAQNTKINGGEIKENAYSASRTGLSYKTQYWYKAFVTLDSQTFYGEVKTFTMDVVPVESVSLDKTSITLYEGQEQILTPTVNPSNAADKTITWTSSDTSVAKVDEEGKVTAVSKGTATITATANDGSGKYASCSVTVKRLVSSIQLNKSTLVLYRGASDVTETLAVTITPSDASNTAVTWGSSNTSVATVSSSGIVSGKSKGTAIITVTANDGSGVQATCNVEVKQYVTSISLNKGSLSLPIGAESTLSVTSILPDNANDKTYTWSSSDNAIATVDNSGKVTAKAKGKVFIRATANDGSGRFSSCSVVVYRIPEAVDLGLSVKWASFNIGAGAPEEYGDYYAWGETQTKSDYWFGSYKFGDSIYGPFSKYNTKSSYGYVDNMTVLDPEDDMAHVRLGGNWRMPTDAEWKELITKCTWTWTTQNGVKGRKVTGPNGNSIFLPAAGNRTGSSLKSGGSYGYYWSSSLCTDNPYGALCVEFTSENVDRYGYSRCYGLSVRPVTE